MRATLTENYILVETDDIDFSVLRLAVEQERANRHLYYLEDLIETIIEEL